MTRHVALHKKLTQILSPIADRQGEVMYSPVEALCKNEVYLLGYNPGQGGPDTSIQEHLSVSLQRTSNAWLDEKWKNGVSTTPLQRRMQKLFEDAGLNLRITPASNLIFATSPDAGGVDFKLADLCWPVHQLIMSIVQPSKLIVFGNGEYDSPYAYIRSRYAGVEERYPVAKNYTLKRWITNIDARPTRVFGIPHLSRFPPKQETVEWIS